MEKLHGILAAAAGVAATEAAELASTDEGLDTLQSKISAKLADVKKNEGKRVLKDTRKAVETALQAAGVDADVFDEGREFKENLAAAVEALQSKTVADTGKGLTEEQVLKHPAVIKLKNELTLDTDRKVTAAKAEVAEALKKEQEDFRKEQNLVGVRAWAEKQVDELNPIFSTTSTIAAAQRKDLVDKIISAGTYQKEGDAYVLVDDKGEIIKDAMQNAVKPETKARQLAETFYGLPVSNPRDTPPLTAAEIAAGARAKQDYTGPKTRAEYDAKVLTLNSREERQALKESFDAYEKETTTAV